MNIYGAINGAMLHGLQVKNHTDDQKLISRVVSVPVFMK